MVESQAGGGVLKHPKHLPCLRPWVAARVIKDLQSCTWLFRSATSITFIRRARPFMNLELFLATITVDHFPFLIQCKLLALAEQVSYCKLRLASCGIASVPPPRHQHPRCFHKYLAFMPGKLYTEYAAAY